MPIYEYRCNACNAELEKLLKVSDPPLVECPQCGKPALEKLVSASSFRLKGSGWYESDFKTGKKKNGLADAAETSGAGKEGGKESSKEGGKESIKEGGKEGSKEGNKESSTARAAGDSGSTDKPAKPAQGATTGSSPTP